MELNILNRVNSPKDLKRLDEEELMLLAEEIREVIIEKVSQTGGHFGPNLGMVEATIAMHYVFNSPVDKIVYDVSHQCYPHKILTGRKHGFIDPEQFGSITGYSSPRESEHDFFTVGHTPSYSLATRLLLVSLSIVYCVSLMQNCASSVIGYTESLLSHGAVNASAASANGLLLGRIFRVKKSL